MRKFDKSYSSTDNPESTDEPKVKRGRTSKPKVPVIPAVEVTTDSRPPTVVKTITKPSPMAKAKAKAQAKAKVKVVEFDVDEKEIEEQERRKRDGTGIRLPKAPPKRAKLTKEQLNEKLQQLIDKNQSQNQNQNHQSRNQSPSQSQMEYHQLLKKRV
jgi:hypothetical protein